MPNVRRISNKPKKVSWSAMLAALLLPAAASALPAAASATEPLHASNTLEPPSQLSVGSRKHVLFLAVDDLRPLIDGFPGNKWETPMHTPHLPALMHNSLALANAHVQQVEQNANLHLKNMEERAKQVLEEAVLQPFLKAYAKRTGEPADVRRVARVDTDSCSVRTRGARAYFVTCKFCGVWVGPFLAC